MRCVLDTNVIISAFITAAGKPARILQMVLERKFDLCHNSIILSEYEGVAGRTKFAESIDQNQVRRFIDIIKTVGISFMPQASPTPLIDETDRIFYDTAKGSDSILITGNIKHFPHEPFIMLPSDFLNSYGIEHFRS
jgi:putative PIN family toxin of toxin-antitoxin system